MNDSELIASLGGPTKLAKRLNFPKKGGAQRVSNWLTRRIPPEIKLAFPAIFLRKLPRKTDTTPA